MAVKLKYQVYVKDNKNFSLFKRLLKRYHNYVLITSITSTCVNFTIWTVSKIDVCITVSKYTHYSHSKLLCLDDYINEEDTCICLNKFQDHIEDNDSLLTFICDLVRIKTIRSMPIINVLTDWENISDNIVLEMLHPCYASSSTTIKCSRNYRIILYQTHTKIFILKFFKPKDELLASSGWCINLRKQKLYLSTRKDTVYYVEKFSLVDIWSKYTDLGVKHVNFELSRVNEKPDTRGELVLSLTEDNKKLREENIALTKAISLLREEVMQHKEKAERAASDMDHTVSILAKISETLGLDTSSFGCTSE